MILGVSFSDVRDLPEFKGLSEFDLLPREMDSKVLPLLYHHGADIDKPYLVQACKHRNLRRQIVVGYRYCFMERMDRDWLAGPRASMAARIESQSDPYLKTDMIRMSQEGMSPNQYRAMVVSATGQEGTTKTVAESYENDMEDVQKVLASLSLIQEQVRGKLNYDEDFQQVSQYVVK